MLKSFVFLALNSLIVCVMTALRKEYQRIAGANLKSTVFFMLINGVIGCIIGLAYCFFTNFALVKGIDGKVFALATAFAIILTLNTIVCIYGAKYGSVAIFSVFATMGTLVISSAYGLIFAPEKNKLDLFSVLGIIIVILVVALNFVNTKTVEVKTSKKDAFIYKILCIVVFFTNGSALPVYSMFTSNCLDYGQLNYIFLYLFLTFIICMVLYSIISLVTKNKQNQVKDNAYLSKKPFLCSVIYGVVLIASEFFGLTVTTLLPIVIQAPLSFAMVVVLVAIVDYFVYKVKPTKIQIGQMILAVISAVLFAL